MQEGSLASPSKGLLPLPLLIPAHRPPLRAIQKGMLAAELTAKADVALTRAAFGAVRAVVPGNDGHTYAFFLSSRARREYWTPVPEIDKASITSPIDSRVASPSLLARAPNSSSSGNDPPPGPSSETNSFSSPSMELIHN